jgi:hypothetical protein
MIYDLDLGTVSTDTLTLFFVYCLCSVLNQSPYVVCICRVERVRPVAQRAVTDLCRVCLLCVSVTCVLCAVSPSDSLSLSVRVSTSELGETCRPGPCGVTAVWAQRVVTTDASVAYQS